MTVAQYCLTALNKLLHSDSVPTIKAVIPILSTIYPILFRLLATSRPSQQVLDLFNVTKSKIISFALDPNARPFNVGIKAVAWKFVQRVLLAATRAAGSDPRVCLSPLTDLFLIVLQLPQRGAGSNDVNVSHIVPNGCLSASDIEKEGTLLQTQLVTHLYSSSEPAILHPLINTLPAIAKMRPTLAPLVVHSLASWTPSALVAAGRSAMEIRAVDKTVRIAISHLLRHPPLSAHAAQLNDSLVRQKARMEAAFISEASARKERRQNLKHTIDPEAAFEAESSEQAAKRARLDGLVGVGNGMGKGPEIDVSGMRLEEVVEVVLSSLRSVSLELLTGTIEVSSSFEAGLHRT